MPWGAHPTTVLLREQWTYPSKHHRPRDVSTVDHVANVGLVPQQRTDRLQAFSAAGQNRVSLHLPAYSGVVETSTTV